MFVQRFCTYATEPRFENPLLFVRIVSTVLAAISNSELVAPRAEPTVAEVNPLFCDIETSFSEREARERRRLAGF